MFTNPAQRKTVPQKRTEQRLSALKTIEIVVMKKMPDKRNMYFFSLEDISG